jgi:hypothetical protein
MSNKSQELNANIKEYIDIIEEYKLFTTEMLNGSIDANNASNDKYYIFKNLEDDKTSYNIFYENIHIRMETSPKETVYSVHIKAQSELWKFVKKDNEDKYDISHPSTQTYRVFVAYDVPVLNITRAIGEAYINGNWDKYLFKTLNEFDLLIKGCTDKAQFNKEYK